VVLLRLGARHLLTCVLTASKTQDPPATHRPDVPLLRTPASLTSKALTNHPQPLLRTPASLTSKALTNHPQVPGRRDLPLTTLARTTTCRTKSGGGTVKYTECSVVRKRSCYLCSFPLFLVLPKPRSLPFFATLLVHFPLGWCPRTPSVETGGPQFLVLRVLRTLSLLPALATQVPSLPKRGC
jgi:hypothetical protein